MFALARLLVVALVYIGSVAFVPSVVQAASQSCSLIGTAPSYTFIGGGFHMQLAIEFPAGAREVAYNFDLPKSFFIDEAEAEQLYRMEIISSVPSRQGTAAVVMRDVTEAYTPLQMASQYFFDIEAPVFKVNYSTNHVVLSFQQKLDTPVLDDYLGSAGADGADAKVMIPVKARLVIPIHSRYDTLDTTTKFSVMDFVMGEKAYVHRCLPLVEMRGVADGRCSGAVFSSSAAEVTLREQPQYQACLELPVGLLDDLPYVYRALMALLVAGAVIVILAIR